MTSDLAALYRQAFGPVGFGGHAWQPIDENGLRLLLGALVDRLDGTSKHADLARERPGASSEPLLQGSDAFVESDALLGEPLDQGEVRGDVERGALGDALGKCAQGARRGVIAGFCGLERSSHGIAECPARRFLGSDALESDFVQQVLVELHDKAPSTSVTGTPEGMAPAGSASVDPAGCQCGCDRDDLARRAALLANDARIRSLVGLPPASVLVEETYGLRGGQMAPIKRVTTEWLRPGDGVGRQCGGAA